MDKLRKTVTNNKEVKEKRIPLSQKAKARIIAFIEENDLKADQKIPSEHELVKMLGISRYTIREALALIEQEGLIYKIQGKGTYVKGYDVEIQAGLEKLDSITEIIKKFGYVPNTKWISIKEESPTRDMMEKLHIDKMDKVITFRRIRMADDKPSAYLVDTIPKKLLNDNIPKRIKDQSLFAYLERKFDIFVDYARADIIPVFLTNEMKKHLNVNKNIPFLLLKQIHYDKDCKALLYSLDYFDPNVFKFKVNRKI